MSDFLYPTVQGLNYLQRASIGYYQVDRLSEGFSLHRGAMLRSEAQSSLHHTAGKLKQLRALPRLTRDTMDIVIAYTVHLEWSQDTANGRAEVRDEVQFLFRLYVSRELHKKEIGVFDQSNQGGDS
jgi:hypothetical protein